MLIDQPLRDDDIQWLDTYAREVQEVFCARFTMAPERFKTPNLLLNRFSSSVEAVKANDRTLFRGVDEAHNELCIASALLDNQGPYFNLLEYEPSLGSCARTIDFLATSNDLKVYVDVKTIKPVPTDRWDQYMRAQVENWLPENVAVMLEKEWCGGELWHNMFAARSRMLEYSLELEQKIADGNLMESNAVVVLALCGEGFYWRQGELEDFVAYYYSGTHRADDPFSLVESQHIQDRKIVLAKTISHFACMQRHQGDILQKRLNWSVKPPSYPNLP